jgi:hypothetical protein
MEACSAETSADIHRTTRRCIPENITLHTHRCENLKPYSLNQFKEFGTIPTWQEAKETVINITGTGIHPHKYKTLYAATPSNCKQLDRFTLTVVWQCYPSLTNCRSVDHGADLRPRPILFNSLYILASLCSVISLLSIISFETGICYSLQCNIYGWLTLPTVGLYPQ